MKFKFLLFFVFVITSLSGQILKTYIYSIKGSDTLRMDVYSPDDLDDTDSLPVILWMHGGGFSGGKRDNGDEVKLAQYAASHGYIGISISYRLTRKGNTTGFGCACPAKNKIETFRNATIDFLDAAKYVTEHNRDLRADVTKIIAGGSSAGAEAVLSAVFMKDYYIKDASKYKNIRFAGLISLAGAMVDRTFINHENIVPTALFHGTEDNLVPFGKAPHHYCSPDDPGYLILEGSSVIVDKLKALDGSYYFNEVRGAKHEISAIPFDDLDNIFGFFLQTIFKGEIIQTRKIIN